MQYINAIKLKIVVALSGYFVIVAQNKIACFTERAHTF